MYPYLIFFYAILATVLIYPAYGWVWGVLATVGALCFNALVHWLWLWTAWNHTKHYPSRELFVSGPGGVGFHGYWLVLAWMVTIIACAFFVGGKLY